MEGKMSKEEKIEDIKNAVVYSTTAFIQKDAAVALRNYRTGKYEISS